METLLDEAINASKSDTTQMPKYLPLSTAQRIETVSALSQKVQAPSYKVGTAERFMRGAGNAVAQMALIAPALQLYGEEAQLGLGGYFGAKEEYIDRKKLNIATLQRNLVAQQQTQFQDLDQETADSWAFKIGSGVTNLATMAIGGGTTALARGAGMAATKAAVVGATAGIVSAIPLENIEQQSDRIKLDAQGNVDTSNITPEWARKAVGGETFYMVGMGILEAKVGLFKDLKQWQKPIPFKNKLFKNLSVPATLAVKTAINEGVTESSQSLLSTGIQLLEGNITLSDLPDRLQQAWQEGIIAMLYGGATGTAVGINQAQNVKKGLTEIIEPVIKDPDITEQIVDAIYDSGTAEMTNVISRELELSSELNNKHGAIYDTMQGAIYDAINNAGAFQGVEEAEIAQYVSDTSKMFANQVLAEANKRGVLIDEVLKASDIKFENGKIYMQAGKEVIAENAVTEENPEALKGNIEINVNEQGEETISPETNKWLNKKTQGSIYKGKTWKEIFEKRLNPNETKSWWIEKVYKTGDSLLGDDVFSHYQLRSEEGYKTRIPSELNNYIENNFNTDDKYITERKAPVKMDENGQGKLFQAAISPKTSQKAREVLTALQKIANGSEEETVKNLRDDLEQYGGTNDVTFVFGDDKKGIKHIAQEHGKKILLKVFDTVIDGDIKRYVEKKKTIILGKGNYEAVLSLDEHGKKKTWLLSGWDITEPKKKSSGVNGEVSTQSATTQIKPTFSRQDLGAELSNIITDNAENLNPSDTKLLQIKNAPKQPKIFKGAFDVSAKAIELFKDADYSTLPHELAHFWLDNMWGYYRSGKASEAYTNNFKGVLDWLEVKDGQINLTRNQQEKFARGYEKYLLNGYAPNGLIQGAFDDYDKWLQKVYNDARELKVKLTPDAIEFFDTMTTGELPEYDVPETQAQIREKNIEQMNKDIQEARKFVVEKQTQYNNYDGGNVITKDTVPVTTEGEKKQSRAYTNQASILGIAEELNYNKADIAEQNKLASEYVKNNLDEARQVVNGEKEAPSDILKNAIYNAYLKEMLAIGDNEAYVNALKNQSLELTRAGQEIASQRGAIENIFDSAYWIRRIENLKKMKLAGQKFGGVTGQETEQALSKMNDFIKNKVEAIMPEFMKAEPEQQKKIAEKLSKEIAAEFKVKPDTKLYQTMYEPSEVRTRTNAYNYIYRYINGALGLDLTREQYNEIIAKTMAIQKSIETTRNRNGNPSALFFKNISEMEAYANSIEPSPALAILTSTVGRGNMLFSPKTIALNIESNIVNFFTEAITRRIQNGAVSMVVDNQAIKDYLAYSREVFNTSGYQVSSMPSLDPTTQILSEKMTTTAGDRVVDKLGRFFEQTIFKYGLGAPDLFFKDMTFVDTANILATKEANGDSQKATELFKDICLIEPKTAKGKELREIAINEALIATYQNKGKTSDLALGIRNAINKASGSANLGDMLSPFVKTPANVIGLGFDYSMGGLVALKNIQTIYNDIQNGTFTDTTRKSLRSLARNGIGFVAAAMIASMIDDDDYIPEYALLSPRERELVKMKGGVFNSVKIGNKYISLDYFGPLAMPLVSILNARRGSDAKEKAWNYFQGSAYQALKLPVIGDIKSLLEGTGRTLTKDVDENIKMAEDAAIDFISSRSIPAIVTDIAKMTDEYERETNNNAVNRLKSKIPVIREELPAQYNYGTGKPRETQNPISQLLAGARIKDEITSPVIREIDKLLDKGESITLQKVTKSGKLAGLSDNDKVKAEREFAKIFATNVNLLIHTPEYKMLNDEEKAVNINNIRSLAVGQIKAEYGLDNKEKSPKRKKLTKKLQ